VDGWGQILTITPSPYFKAGRWSDEATERERWSDGAIDKIWPQPSTIVMRY